VGKLRYGSLFSGIGGFDLGFDRAGMGCAWQCEIDPKASLVLAKHWPNVARYEDVRTIGKHNLEPVDVICGGFPCQDVSLAGNRAGLEGERSTLWSEFARIVCELKPGWVVVENVRGLLSSDNGRFFGNILRDLAECGYDAEWQVLRASDFGAPHRRERVFIVANPNGIGRRTGVFAHGENDIYKDEIWDASKNIRSWHEWERWLNEVCQAGYGEINSSDFCGMDDGISEDMDRLHQLGNAVVPQIAEWIGRRIVNANR